MEEMKGYDISLSYVSLLFFLFNADVEDLQSISERRIVGGSLQP